MGWKKTPQSFVELCFVLVDHQKVLSLGNQTNSKLCLVQSFANTKMVVVKKASVNHQLKTAILQKKYVLHDCRHRRCYLKTGTSLSSICYDSKLLFVITDYRSDKWICFTKRHLIVIIEVTG